MVSFTCTKQSKYTKRKVSSIWNGSMLVRWIYMQVCSQGVIPHPCLQWKINLLCLFHSLNNLEKHFFLLIKTVTSSLNVGVLGTFFPFVFVICFFNQEKNMKCIFSVKVQHFHRLASYLQMLKHKSKLWKWKLIKKRCICFNLRKLYYVTRNYIFFRQDSLVT